MLPLLTRDVHEVGLICQHCSETLVPFEDIPAALHEEFEALGCANTPPSTPSPTGTTASAKRPAIMTAHTKARRNKPNSCWPRPGASSLPGCSSSTRLRSGKIRTSASKCARKTCSSNPLAYPLYQFALERVKNCWLPLSLPSPHKVGRGERTDRFCHLVLLTGAPGEAGEQHPNCVQVAARGAGFIVAVDHQGEDQMLPGCRGHMA